MRTDLYTKTMLTIIMVAVVTLIITTMGLHQQVADTTRVGVAEAQQETIVAPKEWGKFVGAAGDGSGINYFFEAADGSIRSVFSGARQQPTISRK